MTLPALKRPIVGIDLGGTNMQIGVVGPGYKLIGREKAKTRAKQGHQAVIERIAEGVRIACAQAGVPVSKLGAVGIGAPGAIDAATGMVIQAPNLRWTRVPLAKMLQEMLKVRVAVTNDVRAAALGEHALGAGKGVRDMICVWIGTGVGGGLILNDQLYTGHFNAAGEIGHMTILTGAPPGGTSLEQNCSRTAIVDRIIRLIKTGHKSMIPDMLEGEPLDGESVKARIVADAYAKGDEVTRLVVNDAAKHIGIAVASLSSALSMQRVVLGGGLTEAMGDALVRPVREAFASAVYPHINRKCEIIKTKLEADAGVFGAAVYAMRAGGKRG
ncbi:MAG: ROK family protein [Phycisphaerales bacterium]|nr:ROK family protein [Phycisphaerales bacterium]